MLTRYIKKVCSSKVMQQKTQNAARDINDTQKGNKFYGFIAK